MASGTRKTTAHITKALISSLRLLLVLALVALPTAQAAGPGEVVTYYHFDHLGSPVAATNPQGQVLWVREFSAFGEANQHASAVQVGYTGHEYIEESGLTYMQARWYNAELGRFLQPDPVGFVEGNTLSFNRYAYVNNSPYTHYDPDGHYALTAIDVISIGLGVRSAMRNFSQGNTREALFDVAGVVVDGVGLLLPVPAGVGLTRQAIKQADNVADMRRVSQLCSFAAGTPVWTPHGQYPIESLGIGALVIAKDEHSLDMGYKRIVDAYNHHHTDGLVIVFQTQAGQREAITTTGEHPFFVVGKGFTPAEYLTIGQRIETVDGGWAEIVEIDNTPLELVAYNYTVADFETYYVGELGLWVHNACNTVTTGPAPNGGNARPHGNANHDSAIDNRIHELHQEPSISNIRKNQQQVDVNGNKVGTNRPDIQYDQGGCHYCVEYDHVPRNSTRHGDQIRANDPNVKVELNLL